MEIVDMVCTYHMPEHSEISNIPENTIFIARHDGRQPADSKPSRRIPTGMFVRTMGLLLTAALAVSCSPSSEILVQQLATAQAELGQESDMKYVSEAVKEAMMIMEIVSQAEINTSGQMSSKGQRSMGVIVGETERNDGTDTLEIATSNHTLSVEGLWKSVNIQNAFGKFFIPPIDATMNAPGGPAANPDDWYIETIVSLNDKVSKIIIHKPNSVPQLTSSPVTISPTLPYEGQEVVMIQGPKATNYNSFAACATIIDALTDQSGFTGYIIDQPAMETSSNGIVLDQTTGFLLGLIEGKGYESSQTLFYPLFQDSGQ